MLTRRHSRGQGQADLPAEQPASCAGARIPAADAHSCRTRHRVRSARQGPSLADRLIAAGQAGTVLPAQHRMTRSTEFGHTVKNGVRAGQPDVVLHLYRGAVSSDANDAPGPRVGLVVGKSVGNAVVRHRVSRRLRHVMAGLLTELEPDDRLVIRALPGSRDSSSADLERQLRVGLRRRIRT